MVAFKTTSISAVQTAKPTIGSCFPCLLLPFRIFTLFGYIFQYFSSSLFQSCLYLNSISLNSSLFFILLRDTEFDSIWELLQIILLWTCLHRQPNPLIEEFLEGLYLTEELLYHYLSYYIIPKCLPNGCFKQLLIVNFVCLWHGSVVIRVCHLRIFLCQWEEWFSHLPDK